MAAVGIVTTAEMAPSQGRHLIARHVRSSPASLNYPMSRASDNIKLVRTAEEKTSSGAQSGDGNSGYGNRQAVCSDQKRMLFHPERPQVLAMPSTTLTLRLSVSFGKNRTDPWGDFALDFLLSTQDREALEQRKGTQLTADTGLSTGNMLFNGSSVSDSTTGGAAVRLRSRSRGIRGQIRFLKVPTQQFAVRTGTEWVSNVTSN